MGAKYPNKPEVNLQESSSAFPVPKDGLKILARIIARHLEKERQQLKQHTIADTTETTGVNGVEQGKVEILRRHKEAGDG